MFACALVIILLLLYKCVLVYSITIYAISAYRVLSRCVLIGETMSNDELNPEQKNDIKQKIWSLRNKMEEQFKQLEAIHTKPFQTVGDGVDALYAVYHTWDSGEYSELETLIQEIRGEA